LRCIGLFSFDFLHTLHTLLAQPLLSLLLPQQCLLLRKILPVL
jgi:hypothetical protein